MFSFINSDRIYGRRRGAEAVQDRDSRLSDLQMKMEELSREKVRAVEDTGSEVARLEMRLATAIKDNGELLRRTRCVRWGWWPYRQK